MSSNDKIDMKKTLKECYTAGKEVSFVEIPAISYIGYEGKGDPNTAPEYQNAMEVLFGTVYTLKFMLKERGMDFAVMPLEGQWWTENPADFTEYNKDGWSWKMMVAVPDFIDETLFEEAREKFRRKKDTQGLDKARLEILTDGLSAQFLYLGPYSGEAPFIALMHRTAEEQGYRLRGRHREIYLNSPQRTAPEKLKTIIRQPVEKA